MARRAIALASALLWLADAHALESTPALPQAGGEPLAAAIESRLPPGLAAGETRILCQVVVRRSGMPDRAKCGAAAGGPSPAALVAAVYDALREARADAARFSPARLGAAPTDAVATVEVTARCDAARCRVAVRPAGAPQELLVDGTTWFDRVVRSEACPGHGAEWCTGEPAYGLAVFAAVDAAGRVRRVDMSREEYAAVPAPLAEAMAAALLDTLFAPARGERGVAVASTALIMALHHATASRLESRICVPSQQPGARVPDVDCYSRERPAMLRDGSILVQWAELPATAVPGAADAGGVANGAGADAAAGGPRAVPLCADDTGTFCVRPAAVDAGRRPLARYVKTPARRRERDGQVSVHCQVLVGAEGRVEASKCVQAGASTIEADWSAPLAVQRAIGFARFRPARVGPIHVRVSMPLRVEIRCERGRCERRSHPNHGHHAARLGDDYYAPQEIVGDAGTWYDRVLADPACGVAADGSAACADPRGESAWLLLDVDAFGRVAEARAPDDVTAAGSPATALPLPLALSQARAGEFIPAMHAGRALALATVSLSLHVPENARVPRRWCRQELNGEQCFSRQEYVQRYAARVPPGARLMEPYVAPGAVVGAEGCFGSLCEVGEAVRAESSRPAAPADPAP